MIYRLFNMTIDADIRLPLLRGPMDGTRTDLVFREGSVPREVEKPIREDSFYQVGEREFLLEIKGVARFWVSDGGTVIYERLENASDGDISMFLIGSILGGALMLRGIFLLHACAVSSKEGTIVIAGERGSGKSTLTAALVRQGCRLVADDVCLLTLTEGKAVAHPGHPHIKLWSDSLSMLGITPEGLSRVRIGEDKFYWPVGSSFEETPRPVSAFFELALGDGETVSLSGISGIDRILSLARNTYRGDFVEYLRSRGEHISYWSRIAGCFPQFRLLRPPVTGITGDEETIAQLVKEIEHGHEHRRHNDDTKGRGSGRQRD